MSARTRSKRPHLRPIIWDPPAAPPERKRALYEIVLVEERRTVFTVDAESRRDALLRIERDVPYAKIIRKRTLSERLRAFVQD